MKFGVTPQTWMGRPLEEVIEVAKTADALGFSSLWLPEAAAYDVFVLATYVGLQTEQIEMVLGALPVTVRDPVTIARGISSVQALTGRTTSACLGTSSNFIVETWHGRSREHSGTALGESARALRALLAGEKSQFDGKVLRTNGFKLRLGTPPTPITLAAFGPYALKMAARYADRLVLNLLDADTAKSVIEEFASHCADAGRDVPPVALWVGTAIGQDDVAFQQLRSATVGYLMAPGYSDMFAKAGYGELIDYARTRPHPRELMAKVPDELVHGVSIIGDQHALTGRIKQYAAAGVDELIFQPAATAGDPAARQTLTRVVEVAFPARRTNGECD